MKSLGVRLNDARSLTVLVLFDRPEFCPEQQVDVDFPTDGGAAEPPSDLLLCVYR